MKAVILDNDPLSLSLLANTLHHSGYEVLTYSNPMACPLYSHKACPCKIDLSCPSIIISAYNMPVVNGVEFIEALRRNGCRSAHIALLSSHMIPMEMLERASKMDVKFFAKPLHRSQIEDWLNRMKFHPLPKRKPRVTDAPLPVKDHSHHAVKPTAPH